MDNPEEVLHSLDEFAKLKPKSIPRELEDYLMYVARTGDPVYQWPTVKILFREKLLNVITEFYESSPTIDLTPSPNVDPFNYETMKTVLLERLEAFSNAPFTVQRLCELLTTPRKEYNRPDKFMRAIEKNILVVSTREPGGACRSDSALSESIPNGVSDPPEAQSNQSTSNGTNTTSREENTPQTSTSTVCVGKSVENHEVVDQADLSKAQESASVEPEQAELCVKVGEEAELSKQEEESSESTVKDGGESSEATDSSDSVTFGDVNSTVESSETVKVTSTDCIISEIFGNLNEQNVSVVESSEVQNISVMPPSPDKITTTGEVDVVLDSVSSDVLCELVKESVSESDTKIPSTASEDIATDSEVKITNEATSEVTSEASSEPTESKEVPSNIIDESKSETEEKDVPDSDTAVSSLQEDQPADSTAPKAEEKEASSSDAVPSESHTDTVPDSKLSKQPKYESAEILEGSEATPAVSKVEDVEVEVKVVNSDVEATISSSSSTQGAKSIAEEAMEVDESSCQASTADSDAMEVAEEEEPMELCEENALETMTTSPSESTQ